MTLEMNYLEHFTAAVEAGSIGKAARSLNISQPGLTRSIRILEEQLEVTLLERSVKGVTPTDFGANFYTRAKSILLEANRAQLEIREMRGEIERTLSIATLPTLANFVLPEATIKFMDIHQNVKVRVVQKARKEILSSLVEGEFDIIFSILDDEMLGYKNPDPQIMEQEITSQLLFFDRPSVIVRRDHPVLETKKNIKEELLNYPWIMPRPESDQRLYLNKFYADAGLSLPKIAIECQSTPYLKSLVTQSDYIGFLTTNFVSIEEHTGLIVSLDLPGMKNSIPFGIQYRSDRPVSGLAQSMFIQMEKVCQELSASKAKFLKSKTPPTAGANLKFSLPEAGAKGS
ncbi:MAG: LysR family transcriptional regulator [Rhodospirillaceae bacterium]|jgi:DNA-binding transcriptional LysR family regulator|nr:LysR family transcriptional regulator [Rhodospirillaceae bacterium]MBT4938767.1 LysR family transcriptional regulator [Rhodospirillaceae bacterium]MBT5940536.1 LysR family transcriptional regulator [Rhodospirillaceae bacterium]MBT7268817.1 LysR family transcriptional regulator [Rhodospirillaceae bacterium]